MPTAGGGAGLRREMPGGRRALRRSLEGRLEVALDRWLARRTARSWPMSTGVRDYYVGRGLTAERFTVIPNGVPPVRPSRLTRHELLSELQLPEGSRLVGSVGRLWPQKRVKTRSWVAELLKAIRDDMHLLVIGDGPERTRLHRFAIRWRFATACVFWAFAGRARPAAALRRALSTSGYEGQSNAILEAMAAGLPSWPPTFPALAIWWSTAKPASGALGDRAGLARDANRLLDDAPLARASWSGCPTPRQARIQRRADGGSATRNCIGNCWERLRAG